MTVGRSRDRFGLIRGSVLPNHGKTTTVTVIGCRHMVANWSVVLVGLPKGQIVAVWSRSKSGHGLMARTYAVAKSGAGRGVGHSEGLETKRAHCSDYLVRR